MTASGFGRKGVAAGASAMSRSAGFGAARAMQPAAPEPRQETSAADAEIERRRQAFLASERARGGIAGVSSGGEPSASVAPIAPATRTVFVREKSMTVAYVLWFFACQIAAHRFYLGRTGSAAGMLCLWLGSLMIIMTAPAGGGFASIGLGLVGLIASFIWMIVDAFLIPGMVRRANGPRPETVAYAFA